MVEKGRKRTHGKATKELASLSSLRQDIDTAVADMSADVDVLEDSDGEGPQGYESVEQAHKRKRAEAKGMILLFLQLAFRYGQGDDETLS